LNGLAIAVWYTAVMTKLTTILSARPRAMRFVRQA